MLNSQHPSNKSLNSLVHSDGDYRWRLAGFLNLDNQVELPQVGNRVKTKGPQTIHQIKIREYAKSKSKSPKATWQSQIWHDRQKRVNVFEKDFCHPVKKELIDYKRFGSIDFEQ